MKKTKPRGVTPGWVMYLALVIGVWRRGDARVRVQAGRCLDFLGGYFVP